MGPFTHLGQIFFGNAPKLGEPESGLRTDLAWKNPVAKVPKTDTPLTIKKPYRDNICTDRIIIVLSHYDSFGIFSYALWLVFRQITGIWYDSSMRLGFFFEELGVENWRWHSDPQVLKIFTKIKDLEARVLRPIFDPKTSKNSPVISKNHRKYSLFA